MWFSPSPCAGRPVRRRSLLALCLAGAACGSARGAGIFWQPQNRDLQAGAGQWGKLLDGVRARGIDTLVLQWVAFGSELTVKNRDERIASVIRQAKSRGLKVVLGLHMDPHFFHRQADHQHLAKYLEQLRTADLAAARHWLWHVGEQIDGWYVSAEIDDSNWRDPKARSALLESMRILSRQLRLVRDVPVYISSFFAGNMSPQGYAGLIAELSGCGLSVWVQDGRSAGSLTEPQINLYLKATEPVRAGLIAEIFSMSQNRFDALGRKAFEQRFARYAREPDAVFFSLRYLPEADGVLAR